MVWKHLEEKVKNKKKVWMVNDACYGRFWMRALLGSVCLFCPFICCPCHGLFVGVSRWTSGITWSGVLRMETKSKETKGRKERKLAVAAPKGLEVFDGPWGLQVLMSFFFTIIFALISPRFTLYQHPGFWSWLEFAFFLPCPFFFFH